jgi:archaellum component FlaF (FlaF/FlaG flagellin family)
MQKLLVTTLILCTLSILFAGALLQESNQSNDNQREVAESSARMVSSHPIGKTEGYTSVSLNSNHEDLIITNVESNCTSNTFLVNILNNGSTQTKITDILVNYQSINIEGTIVIQPNSYAVVLVSLNYELIFLRTYEIKIQTSEGVSGETFYVVF